MKKKIIMAAFAFITFISVGIVAYLFNPFTSTGSAVLYTDSSPLGTPRLDIMFTYDKLHPIASNQFAIWLEDMDGNYVDTIFVTRYTAETGYIKRPQSISKWVARTDRANMSQREIDTISGATPKPGRYTASWDAAGRLGEYRYFFEGTLYNDDDVLYSGEIILGDQSWIDSPTPIYSKETSNNAAMLSEVVVSYEAGN